MYRPNTSGKTLKKNPIAPISFWRRQWKPTASTLAWKIPWMEEPGRPAVYGVAKSRLGDLTFTHWRRQWQPTPVFLPGESHTFTASSFRIWKSSTGIPSPPLALFVVMLSKAHLTSHSRMLVITEGWAYGFSKNI